MRPWMPSKINCCKSNAPLTRCKLRGWRGNWKTRQL
jgi:hypothetical protein